MPIGKRTCDLRRTDKNPEMFTHRQRLAIKKSIARSSIALVLSAGLTGCATVPVPESALTFEQRDLSPQEVSEVLKSPPRSADAKSAQYSAIPADGLALPQAGQKTPLEVVVSSDLEAAFEAYFHGRGEAALTRLTQDFDSNPDPRARWQNSLLRAQTLIMMGRAALAEEELERTSHLEKAIFGSDLNALALRGEAKLWLDDYEGAFADFAHVVAALGTWELPIQYLSFPANRDVLYYATTAKLRAFTGIAGCYLFKEDYKRALAWASEAERLFNNAHFVTTHPLYGMGDQVYADSYYGRAMNLVFLASATLATTGNEKNSEALFNTAGEFFSAINFSVGHVSVSALKARILNQLGQTESALNAAKTALTLASDANLPDYVWRIGVMTGVALSDEGRMDEAEGFLRQAQNAVDQVSGNLSSDRSRLRFGIGKDDIIHHLAQIDIQKKRWDLLFSDLEKARARAFIDLLADQALSQNRESALVAQIRDLESQILAYRLIVMAPGGADADTLAALEALAGQRQQKLDLLTKRDPEVADLITVRSVTLESVQARLKPGEVMAYAIPGRPDDAVRFLLITPQNAFAKTLFLSYRELDDLLDRFSKAFGVSSSQRGISQVNTQIPLSSSSQQKSILNELQRVFPPDWSGAEELLYIVPSSGLYFVPWSLMETSYPVITLPTGGWVTREHAARAPSSASAVIVGDPEFGGELTQLPGAREEAIAVARLYEADALLGGDASEGKLRRAVGEGAGVLHLATHGVFDHDVPLNSAVMLSNGTDAESLTAEALFENPLPARLVVLSGCETGLGRAIAGDDLIGLTRSFFLGGANTVLSSLWRIDDAGTVAYMKKFHEAAQQGDFGGAWLAARDDLKARGYPASVYGAFVLAGARH